VFLRGGGKNAFVVEGGIIGFGTCLIVGGFFDRSIGAGGDVGLRDVDEGRLESSGGLGGGMESVLRGGRPGRASSTIGGGIVLFENPKCLGSLIGACR
jgi:hypothetical protein